MNATQIYGPDEPAAPAPAPRVDPVASRFYAPKASAEVQSVPKSSAPPPAAHTRESAEAVMRADPEFGGANFSTSFAHARKAVGATPGLAQALDETGLGNDPAVIRIFAKLGKAIK